MAKEGGQKDQKNIVYDDAVDDYKINNLNENGLHLRNSLGENLNNGNNEHNCIEQGGIINEQDKQGNYFADANNNPQAQDKKFGEANELDQNNIDNDNDNDNEDNNDNNDNDNKGQNRGGNNNNHAGVSDNDGS